jgi:uncharacterized protein YjbI with pentapeptide repeats
MRIYFVIALLLATGCSATQNESTASTAELVETTLGAPTTTVSVRVAECLETKQCDGAVLAGESLAGADLYYANLRRAKLVSADLSGANLEGANLEGADLSGADLSGANLVNAKVSGAKFSGARFAGATFLGLYEGADASDADFRGANFLFVLDLDRNWTEFEDFDLSGANFSGCDVSGLAIEGNAPDDFASTNGANFDGVRQSSEDNFFSMIYVDCSSCTFRSADLPHSPNFGEVNLAYSDLTGAVIQNGMIVKVDFSGANLTNTSFLNAWEFRKNVFQDTIFSNTTMPDGTIRDK